MAGERLQAASVSRRFVKCGTDQKGPRRLVVRVIYGRGMWG